MHHGQSRGGNTHEVCKKLIIFSKTGGTFVKVGWEIRIFVNQGGKCTKRGKIVREIRNLWPMTKKRSAEILAAENGKFFPEKVKFLKFSTES